MTRLNIAVSIIDDLLYKKIPAIILLILDLKGFISCIIDMKAFCTAKKN